MNITLTMLNKPNSTLHYSMPFFNIQNLKQWKPKGYVMDFPDLTIVIDAMYSFAFLQLVS